MTKINQIEQAIIALSPGAFQKLMDEYLIKKYHFENYTPYGSHTGTDKTTQGTPDSYVNCANGKKILIQHGSVGKAFSKVKDDLLDCLNPEKTGIPVEEIEQIICCHTSTNFSPGQTAELESLFANIIIIGLGDISYDLLNKYQGIALDHLGISLDTHQFFNQDDFIKEYEKNAYSTSLDMPLLGRKNELDQLVCLIESTNVVMLYGASGIGKTKLSMEAAKQYADTHKAKLLFLKGNGESIFNDCTFYIDDGIENVIVIDDANHLPQIQYLLGMAEDKNRPYPLKLILTVRDYIRQELIKRVSEISKPKTQELKPLSNESIEKILKEIFHIQNHELIQHIQRIAKGNARLAVMAAKCVIDKNYEAVKNAFELFSGYYSPIISRLDQDEITVAFLIAFFDGFKLNESALAIKIAQDNGISYSDFITHCKQLHMAEVVNLLDNRAVRFDNQNLRDYLLYYCLIQEKWITPSELITYAFPKHRNRIAFAFSTLLNLFRSDEIIEYLTQEVQMAWNSIRQHDDESVLNFIETFWSLIPDESLLFIKKKIDTLPVLHSEIDLTNLPKQSGFRSPLLEILSYFYASDLFEDALDLVFCHLERNTENIGDFCLLFSERWGFSHRSHLNNYSNELMVIENLLKHYQKSHSDRHALCLYTFIERNLECNFSSYDSYNGTTITYYNFQLPACEPIYQIRRHCIDGLSRLLSHPVHQELADNILSDLTHKCNACEISIIQADIQSFVSSFAPILHSDNYSHCIYLQQIHSLCMEHNIDYPSSLVKHTDNGIFSRFAILADEFILKNCECENIEDLRYQDIIQLCNTTTDDEFNQLWKALASPPLNSDKFSYNVGNGIDLIFHFLQSDWNRFITCVDGYIKAGAPSGIYSGNLIIGLINKLGYEESERYISSFDFARKYQWIANIQNLIPAEKMDHAACERIMQSASLDDNLFIPVDYETALKANRVYPGFMRMYLFMVNQKAAKRPFLLSRFLLPLTVKHHADPQELVHILEDSLEILVDSYCLALHGQEYFDNSGYLLLALVENSNQILQSMISKLLAHNRRNISPLCSLWKSQNYLELVTVAFDTLRSINCYSYFYWGKEFIGKSIKSVDESDPVIIWIKCYISNYSADMSRMEFLFHSLCNCHKEVFKQALIFFCKSNNNFNDFASLPLDATSKSWSGSEIPLINSELDFLEELKQELRGIDFIEHRAHISSAIQSLRAYKSHTEAEDFIERL